MKNTNFADNQHEQRAESAIQRVKQWTNSLLGEKNNQLTVNDSTVADTVEELSTHDTSEKTLPTNVESNETLSEGQSLLKPVLAEQMSVPAKLNDRKSFKQKYLKFLLIQMVALLVLVGLSLIFFDYFTLPGTKLGNQNIGFKRKTAVLSMIDNAYKNYKVEITGGEKTLTPTLEEVGILGDVEKTKKDYNNSQKSILDRLFLWRKHTVSYANRFDSVKAQAYFQTIKQNIDQESLDAFIQIDKGAVTIVPEVISKVSGITDAEKKISDSLEQMSPLTLKMEIYEDTPAIVAADLEAQKTTIENMIATPITLIISGKKIYPSKEQVGSWIALQPKDNAPPIATLDNLKVTSYLESVVKPYIQPPRAKVIVKNEDGTERVLAEGAAGTDVTDKATVVASIIESVSRGVAVNKEIPVSYSEPPTVIAGDYEKWLEADLTTKRLYAYEHGTIVRTFLVTAGAPETPTVVGQFAVRAKVRSQTMRGFNTDGTRYNVPNVEWVSYFYQDYAIHGNYWRADSVFGNQNTSHGCVSLKNDGAEWVYNWAPIGTPVITHY